LAVVSTSVLRRVHPDKLARPIVLLIGSFQHERSYELKGRSRVNMYVIRRPSGWRSPEDLQAAAARSSHVGDEEMSDDIRWIRSYVVHESDGGLGTFCVYQASSPEKIREHAARAGLPATDILEVADTVFVRPDPASATA
jgi:Protein of unknown function (DUF4242)